MTKEEILAGLKQAIERGYSLEQAKQSFINAGYNIREVEEAASMLGGILTQYPQSQQAQTQSQAQTQYQQPQQYQQLPTQPQQIQQQFQPLPQQPQFQQLPEKKFPTLIIILLVIALILIGSLIAVIFFKEKVIEFINRFSPSPITI